MFANSLVALALLAGSVAAQNSSTATIDPTEVSLTLRAQWCSAQQSTCGTLCSGSLANNTCDTATLDYSCLCGANDSAPGLQYYTQTMPTFICTQVFEDCIAAGENDAAAQALCTKTKDANCGTLDPDNFTAPAVSSSSSSATTTPTSTSSSSNTASGSSATSTSSNAAAATLAAARNFGTGALAVGVAAAFGFML